MNKYFAMRLRIVIWILAIIGASVVDAAVVVTPANIDLCGTATTSYRPIPDIVITEAAINDMSTQTGATLILTAPAGFQFNTTNTPATATFIAGNDITAASINAVTNSATITITYTTGGVIKFDVLTISGLQVRATAATSGNITRTGGTATIAGNAVGGGVNHGTLNRPACSTPLSNPCLAPSISDKYCSSGFIHSNAVGTSIFAANTFSSLGCGNNRQYEVFFTFTATVPDYEITGFAGTIGGNSEISILQNTGSPCPGGPATWIFIDASCPAWGTPAVFTGLTPGTQYYLAVDHSGNSGSRGTFDICLNPLPNIVAISGTGVTCATAININASGGLPFTHASTTSGKGDDWKNSCYDVFYPNPTYDFGGGPDMFYKYTSVGNEYLSYELIVSTANAYPVISVLRSCPGGINAGADIVPVAGMCVCTGTYSALPSDGKMSMASSFGTTNGIPCTPIYFATAGTYYFVIDNWPLPNSINYTFKLSALSQASNDNCTGASNVYGGATQGANNAGCNYDWGPDDPNSGFMCATSTENTAWFTFTTEPGATTATFNFSNVAGAIQYGCFSGPCGGPYTKAGTNTANNPPLGRSTANDPCYASSAATQSFTVTGLTPSTQYWLAVDGLAGSNSTFDVFGGSGVLPVTLLSFTTDKVNKSIRLNWATANEINNDYFILEHSSDGINFEILLQIDGAGNSNSTLYYSVIDPKPYQGVNYYRLKQVDFNGTYKNSEIISAWYKGTMPSVELFPNPLKESTFTFIVDESDDIQNLLVSIKTVAGVTIEQRSFSRDELKSAKLNQFQLNQTLPKGVYIVTFQAIDFILEKKLLIANQVKLIHYEQLVVNFVVGRSTHIINTLFEFSRWIQSHYCCAALLGNDSF